jgi:hypothetical protein
MCQEGRQHVSRCNRVTRTGRERPRHGGQGVGLAAAGRAPQDEALPSERCREKINCVKYMDTKDTVEWIGVGGIGILVGIAGYSMIKSFSSRVDTPLRQTSTPPKSPFTSSDLEYETESDVNDKNRTMSVGGRKSKKRNLKK